MLDVKLSKFPTKLPTCEMLMIKEILIFFLLSSTKFVN
nr:MAG TPA: hypothetical protein [Caudoviricetes sp.]